VTELDKVSIAGGKCRLNNLARLSALLENRYGTRIAAIDPIFEAPEKSIYRVSRADGPEWVLRLFPPTRPLDRIEGDAAILRYLADQGVAAERLVAATDGAGATDLDGRGVLVTRFIPGVRLDRTLSSSALRQLGEMVGRLHSLPPIPATNPYLSRRAGSLPKEDLAFAKACLARVADLVPPVRLAEYRKLEAALATTNDCEDMPFGLIHSDVHIANALCTPDGQVVLFDWDGAGQGPRLAALGLLLFTSAVQAPEARVEQPDISWLDAVLEGYLRFHVPSPAERKRLPDAVRFRPTVIAAREFAASVESGIPEYPRGWWQRYGEAEAVAERAIQLMERA
jgi:Ser/Thr protein kinase RdoA (MazF antagonist)